MRHSTMRQGGLLVAGFVLAAVLLYALAWQLVRAGIDQQARAKAALFQSGATPWGWHPRGTADLVAGQVFGNATARGGEDSLRLRAGSDAAYVVGVTLPYPLALARYPMARLSARVDQPTQLSWRVRAKPDGPLLVSASVALAPGESPRRVNLRKLRWHVGGTHKQVAAPRQAAMLRLAIRQPAGATMHLKALEWQPSAANEGLPPVVVLDPGSVRAMLQQRDAIRHSTPERIVVSRGDALQAPPAGGRSAWNAASGLFVWLVFVFLVWRETRRPSLLGTRARALPLLQMTVCVAPLLAWALGLYGASAHGAFWQTAMFVGFGFAVWLAWRGHGRSWAWLRWQGRMDWHDWILPAVSVALTGLLLFAWQARPQGITAPLGLRYAGWALLQQLIMLAVLAPRLQGLLHSRWSCALLVAVIFALAHAPNAWLMELVLLGELLWAWAFLKRPVLVPAVLAHIVCGLLLASAIHGLPLRSLGVGARFLG